MDKQLLVHFMDYTVDFIKHGGLMINDDGIRIQQSKDDELYWQLISTQEFIEIYLLVNLFPNKFLVGEYLNQKYLDQKKSI